MRAFACLICMFLTAAPLQAQDRDTKVRHDRQQFDGDSNWVYNDLPTGFAEAKRTGKPLLVVIRCIP